MAAVAGKQHHRKSTTIAHSVADSRGGPATPPLTTSRNSLRRCGELIALMMSRDLLGVSRCGTLRIAGEGVG